MRSLLRRTAQASSALLLAAGGLMFTGGSAQAAQYDGADPASTYCGGTTGTPRSAAVHDPRYGFHVGTIDLRYNSGCRTVWARITLDNPQGWCGDSAAGQPCATAEVIRESDGATLSCQVPQGGTSCYTRMLNDAGVQSHAQGITYTSGGLRYTPTGSY
ncbi:DUF2690 domain-containing protein [Streptomyces sp. NPDC006553]|uniref:DUF2690 domain-containing protein n=1 Tax=unclassified Streptomyces TaxID=2593676 RepID=UPI0022530446|nr:DUF2690 domain-containing protein [Streptomyces sp. NBC_00233]MCX5226843.1 YjfA family protein [Streptomyces sp. NBC_00233]